VSEELWKETQGFWYSKSGIKKGREEEERKKKSNR
jgi:hypothetical protein